MDPFDSLESRRTKNIKENDLFKQMLGLVSSYATMFTLNTII